MWDLKKFRGHASGLDYKYENSAKKKKKVNILPNCISSI
jgi:hypothetical protein